MSRGAKELVLGRFRNSMRPDPREDRITLTGFRGELTGFHAHTRYPEILKNRDLNQLKELFSVKGDEPGTLLALRLMRLTYACVSVTNFSC